MLTTLLTKLAPLGLAGSGPIPEGAGLPVDPIATIMAGNYLKVPVLADNTRDEAKLFPTFLALPGLGGLSDRLVTDASLFTNHFNHNPDGAPAVAIESWIPGAYLPVSTPVTGFNAHTDLLNAIFFGNSRGNVLNALKSQQADVWYYQARLDQEPATAIQTTRRWASPGRPGRPSCCLTRRTPPRSLRSSSSMAAGWRRLADDAAI